MILDALTVELHRISSIETKALNLIRRTTAIDPPANEIHFNNGPDNDPLQRERENAKMCRTEALRSIFFEEIHSSPLNNPTYPKFVALNEHPNRNHSQ